MKDLAFGATRGGLSLGDAISWEVITLANVPSAYLEPGSVLSTLQIPAHQVYVGGRRVNKRIGKKVRAEKPQEPGR